MIKKTLARKAKKREELEEENLEEEDMEEKKKSPTVISKMEELENTNKLLQELYNLKDAGFYRHEMLVTLRNIGQTLEEIRDVLADSQSDSEDED